MTGTGCIYTESLQGGVDYQIWRGYTGNILHVHVKAGEVIAFPTSWYFWQYMYTSDKQQGCYLYLFEADLDELPAHHDLDFHKMLTEFSQKD